MEAGGTNAKLSELHAAVGLVNCDYLDEILRRRRAQVEVYRQILADVPGICFLPLPGPRVRDNHSYMPILLEKEAFGCEPLALQAFLKEYNVFTRRYFFPLLTDCDAYSQAAVVGELTHARHIVQRVLCLPLAHDLPLDVVEQIGQLVAQCASNPPSRETDRVKHT
jgi:dTDP-4-amino-4,6-dideoxygalactose transaminase